MFLNGKPHSRIRAYLTYFQSDKCFPRHFYFDPSLTERAYITVRILLATRSRGSYFHCVCNVTILLF